MVLPAQAELVETPEQQVTLVTLGHLEMLELAVTLERQEPGAQEGLEGLEAKGHQARLTRGVADRQTWTVEVMAALVVSPAMALSLIHPRMVPTEPLVLQVEQETLAGLETPALQVM